MIQWHLLCAQHVQQRYMRMVERSKEQKLIDIMFEVSLCVNDWTKRDPKITYEQINTWVANQLRQCGFDTFPCGASWGVLKNVNRI